MNAENISTNNIIFSYEVDELEQKDDEMINEIIFKKYQIKKKNRKSSNIDIYDGITLENNHPVLIKIQKKIKEKIFLEEEGYNLYSFKGFGIPELIKIGKRKNSIIIIESKKGRSLYELFLENNKKFSLNTICLIGIQCIERLKWIHSKNYLHRNIKPENFVIGLEDPHVIYLQNFYYCLKYRSSKTHQHIKLKYTKEIVGTERYGSINALKGLTQGRKDDLESLCYMLIYFFLGKLPWSGIREENKDAKLEKILKEKKNFKIEKYPQIPKDFCTLFKYVQNLKFEEEPKYSLMIKILQKILNERNIFNNNCFFWIKDNKICQGANIKTKKEGFRERLFEKIGETTYTENNNIFSGRKVKNIDVTLENIGLGYIDDEDDFEENNKKKYREKSDFQVKIKRSLSFDESKRENEGEEYGNKESDLNASNSSINTKFFKLSGPLESFVKNEIKNDLALKVIDGINNKELENLSPKKNKNKEIIISKKVNNFIINIINEEKDEKSNQINNNEIPEQKDLIYTSENKRKEKSLGISNNNMKQESTKESIQYYYKDNEMEGNYGPGSMNMVNNYNNKIENIEKKNMNSKIIITKKNKFIKGEELQNKRSNSVIKKQKKKDCIIF